MNIDLFLTKHGESGLLCDRPMRRNHGGVIFDAQTQALTVEFSDMDETLHLNIPVEEDHRELLLFSHRIHIAALEDGQIAESIQVPLLYLNDPYGSEFGQGSPMTRSRRSLIAFEQFMKRTFAAQPIHREDLGDETSAGCVLRGMNTASLSYVPQLIRQRMLEASPHMAPSGPSVLAPGMHPKGPGGMGGGTIRRPQPNRRTDLNEEE